MMKRPWQIWLLFGLCLALVLPGMTWLTVKAIDLDRREAAARQQAEESRRLEYAARQQAELARQRADLQERVSSALWRMDWTLAPIVAQEAARPYFAYRPFISNTVNSSGTKGGKEVSLVPSPLLMQPSDFVLLHFQVTPDDLWSSPQSPTGDWTQTAIGNGISEDNIRHSGALLEQLSAVVCPSDLIDELPQRYLPTIAMGPQFANTDNQIQIAFNDMQRANGPAIQSPINSDFESQGSANQGSARNSDSPSQDSPGQSSNHPTSQPTNESSLQGQSQTRGGSYDVPSYDVPQIAQTDNLNQQYGRGRYYPLQQPQNNRIALNNSEPPAPQPQRKPAKVTYAEFYENQQREQMLRGDNEWEKRNRAYQNFAQNELYNQRINNFDYESVQEIGEGVSRPLWVGSNLLLARRVKVGEQDMVQGCWLNWEELKAMLLAEVSDLLPGVDLAQVDADSVVAPGRTLATLPIQIIVPEPMVEPLTEEELASFTTPATFSPISLSLKIAWACLLLATCAVAALLLGVVNLSERRGAFVSAVTHELRTPLTTFRMYAEMLSEGMVQDPKQQQRYLETLKVESNRLSHLVENVLSYAKLERGKPGKRREPILVHDLIERMAPRLAERAEQVEMNLVVEYDLGDLDTNGENTKDLTLKTDPAAVEQILFNLVDNACKYAVAAKDRRLHLTVRTVRKMIEIQVRDHGPGILATERRRLFEPFSKSVQQAAESAPGVGLGLALCRRLASALGGRLSLTPQDEGACFTLTLPLA